DCYTAHDASCISRAEIRIEDFYRSKLARCVWCFFNLKLETWNLRLFNDRKLTGDPNVRQAVAAIRRHFDVNDGIVSPFFHSVDCQANISQSVSDFGRRQLRAGQFAEPVVRDKHRQWSVVSGQWSENY